MIERIARILCEREGGDPDQIIQGEGHAIGQTWTGWQAEASAARKILSAMREPTRRMEDAAYDEDPDRARPNATWQVMIDAELAAYPD